MDYKGYDIIKQIGKGSFSNVYLCKQKNNILSNIGYKDIGYKDIGYKDSGYKDSGYKDSGYKDGLFIIKEININELVKNYMRGKSKVKNCDEYEYEDENRDYYYKRLEELIDGEIDVLTMMDHENVVKFYGYIKKKGVYYLRMEYCDLGDVYELLKSNINNCELKIQRNSFNGFSGDFLYEFIKQTATALKYIHTKNIIHRDIKLHNILIKKESSGFKFKISDFGFACYDISDKNKDFDLDDLLSKKYYKLCGTPYYMAPEIIFNMNFMENMNISEPVKKFKMFYDKSIDIWSYGICIYEVIFNILPFSNIKNMNDMYLYYKTPTIQVIMNKKIKNKIILGSKIKELLLHMICLTKEKRYNIYEIEHCIKNILKNEIFTSNGALQDIVNCKENTYAKNEIMKCNIIRNQLVDPTINSTKSIYSWEKIEQASIIKMEQASIIKMEQLDKIKVEQLDKIKMEQLDKIKVEQLDKIKMEQLDKIKVEQASIIKVVNVNIMWVFDWIFNK
jgi:serine/threonine protein kinase